jgi:hypothetical protein
MNAETQSLVAHFGHHTWKPHRALAIGMAVVALIIAGVFAIGARDAPPQMEGVQYADAAAQQAAVERDAQRAGSARMIAALAVAIALGSVGAFVYLKNGLRHAAARALVRDSARVVWIEHTHVKNTHVDFVRVWMENGALAGRLHVPRDQAESFVAALQRALPHVTAGSSAALTAQYKSAPASLRRAAGV